MRAATVLLSLFAVGSWLVVFPEIGFALPAQLESDARLRQPVKIEILGRALTTALSKLSEKSGVGLGVAPGDLVTLGERKVTVIGQGASLRTLLMEIPVALQDCHWEAEGAGYVLHREADADARMAKLAGEQPAQEDFRPAREKRVEEARRALVMTPQELKELEQTDPTLAACVRDPNMRARVKLVLALPEKDLKTFLETGSVSWPCATASQSLLEEVQQMLREHPLSEADLSRAKITLNDSGAVYLQVGFRTKEGQSVGAGSEPVWWPQYPALYYYSPDYQTLLATITKDLGGQLALAEELDRKGTERQQQQREETRKATWPEPQNPALRKEIVYPWGELHYDRLERLVAKQTGMSLVADYFSPPPYGSGYLPDEAKSPMPLWRLLSVLRDQPEGKEWLEAGECLVLRDRHWYQKVFTECPEALVREYRQRLTRQGELTLEDAVSFARELDRRVSALPGGDSLSITLPADLMTAGLPTTPNLAPVLIYGALTKEQRVQACRPEGVPYAEMTAEPQALMRKAGAGSSAEEVSKGVYRIAFTGFGSELAAQFGGQRVSTWIRVDVPELRESETGGRAK